MTMLVWIMVGIAVWHFTVFLPDRFWGGIVGAFVAAVVGAAVVGFVVSGFTVPGRHDTDFAEFLLGIPGCLIGLTASYLYGTAKGVRGPKI
jgi:uncharacterized membrane protein YeaQ/YmgE (transglycosylase-associated protein family)